MGLIGLLKNINWTFPVVLAVICVTCCGEDGAASRASLVQSIVDAQKHFDSLDSDETPEAVDAMRSVIACKRELLSHLVERNSVDDDDLIRREVLSQARDVSRLAALLEERQEYKHGEAEWVGFADSCKLALGINSPEYWHASQEANALGRMANADSSTIKEYLENRSKRTRAAGQKDTATAYAFALKDHELCCKLFGDLAPRSITSLEYAAKLAFNTKKYGESIQLFEDALQQSGKLYPAWHPDLAEKVFYLGKVYESFGLWDRAESTYRRTAPSLQYWDRVNRLAMNYRRLGQRQNALRLFDEVFKECVATIGENHPIRGIAGKESGDILQSLGRYEQALNRLDACAKIWKANSNRFELAYCLNSIALSQHNSGEHNAAESSYQEAIKLLADESLVDDKKARELEVKIEANYASLLEETGRFAEALKIYGIIVKEKDPDATLSSGLDARAKLALLYQSVGEFAKAETLFDFLLQYRNQWQPRKISQLHSTRGRFYLQVGALDKADVELETALTYLAPDSKDSSIDVATVQGLQALVLLERGEAAAALAKYERVLQSRIESFGPEHMRCAEVYDQIAKVQRTLGRYADATEAHRKAINIHESSYGPGHHAVAWAHHRLGTTHFVFNSPEDAIRAWRRSFEIKQDICQETLPWLPEAQASAFLTTLTTNDSSAGRDTLLSTLSLDKDRNADEAFLCVWRSRGLVLNAIATRERQLINTKRSPERAQLAKIRRRLAQLSLHAGSEDSVHRDARTELLRSLNEEKESLERIIAGRARSNLTDEQLAEVTPQDLMDRLPPKTALVQLVRTERWQPTSPGATGVFKKTVYDAFVVYKTTAASGESDEAGMEVHWVELGDAAEIDDHIATWRKAILIGEGGTRGKRLGKRNAKPDIKSAGASRDELQKRVWKPIANALGNRSRVVIVPDGDFHRMPWIALPGTQSDYLIEEVQITTAADGRQLAQLLQQQRVIESAARESGTDQHSERFLLVGGVEYNAQLPTPEGAHQSQARDTAWPFLKGTREEIAAIGEVVPTEQTRRLVGEHAMEEVVKSEFEKAGVIHVATHGYFSDELDEDLTSNSARGNGVDGDSLGPRQTSTKLTARNPLLQCGLTLAGCNSDVWLDADGLPMESGQDGYLSAEEIMGMDLGKARLVVLSACETGLGSIGSGEGVFGLQRALHISGVKSTIASGWKVDDRATQLLMTEMYHQMFDQGLSAADALHAAQLRVLRHFNRTTGQLEDDNSMSAPPYYWAAFSLSGVR